MISNGLYQIICIHGYRLTILESSVKRFYGRHLELIDQYGITMSIRDLH